MGLKIVSKSVLSVHKKRIPIAFGFADHYFLAVSKYGHDTLGWGRAGIELSGEVKITRAELQRVERFLEAASYSISVHNCEHFANYVLYGINHSSQMYTFFKCIGADIVSLLQPTQAASENYSDAFARQVAYRLNEQLRNSKIERANRERVEFWRLRGVDTD
ncbi:MAG: hypothetical protein QUV07_15365 [Cyanobium sp. CZS 25K]|nr:hypothetical protein [Cyanobium sp. CZS25K]